MEALKLTEAFFNRSPSFPVPKEQLRNRLHFNDVPHTDDSLRKLAKAGAWASVVQLSELLEAQAIDPHTQQKDLEQSFKYVVVRVTAYCRMHEWSRAYQIVQKLGDLDDKHYHPTTGRSVVPFTLHFFRAVLPHYCGQSQMSLTRLHELLSTCEDVEERHKELIGKGAAMDLLRWRERAKRVHRALVSLHLELQQFPAAFTHLQKLVDVEVRAKKEIVLLQQLGCLALRCGNVFLAQEVFRSIELLEFEEDDIAAEIKQQRNATTTSSGSHPVSPTLTEKEKQPMQKPVVEEKQPEQQVENEGKHHGLEEAAQKNLVQFRNFIIEMNKGFLLMYWGRFSEGMEYFRKLMYLDDSNGGGPTGQVYTAMAANSFVVAHQYCRPLANRKPPVPSPSSGPPQQVEVEVNVIQQDREKQLYDVKTALECLDTLIKKNPRLLLSVDATVYNVQMLYALEGDDGANKMQMLEALCECFKCGKEAISKSR